jgi:hypothetical protein
LKEPPYFRFPPSVPGPPSSPLDNYRAVVVGGRIDWADSWIDKVADYVRGGGTVVLNAAQVKGISEQLLGVRLMGATAEADKARCLSPGEDPQDLNGQMFRYEKVELKEAQTLIQAANGDPLVTVNRVGKGTVVFCALPDLLGEDERVTPFAAHMLAHVFGDATTVKVSGDVEYLLNRAGAAWVVTLFNNKGVLKPQQGLAQVDRSAIVSATVSLAGQQVTTATEWIGDKQLTVEQRNGRQAATVSIQPGGIAIVELRTRN